ncbi:MAG: hypothetical protein IKI63_00855, partial [Clostridia bacterium]|nr:hypothetical protein [Clostridia bacterium]
SLGVFVLYELFTTRSAKRLLRILPSFGLVIAIALAGAASIVGAKSALTASVPKRDDIKSVSLLPKADEGLLTSMVSGLFDDSYQNSYYTRLAQNIPTDRESVRTIVAGALQGALASESDDNTYFNNLFAGVSNETRLSVQLKNGQTQTRTLWLSEEQTEAIQSALCLNADYVRAMTQLPDETKDPLVVYAPDQSLTVTQARQVYASLRQEIAEGDPLTWIRVVNSASMYPMSLQMQTIFGSDVVSATLPVTVDYPKTLELYINFARQNVDFEKWLKRYPLTAADIENGSTNIQFSSMDGTLETDGTLDVWMSSDDLDFGDQTIADDWNETVEWIREQVKKPIDVNARYGRVSISTWRWSGAYSSITLFIPMDTVPDALYRLTYNGWHEDEWDDTESDESGEVGESAAPESSAPANNDVTSAPAPDDNTTDAPTASTPTTTAPESSAPAASAPESSAAPDDGTASSGDAWALPAVPI